MSVRSNLNLRSIIASFFLLIASFFGVDYAQDGEINFFISGAAPSQTGINLTFDNSLTEDSFGIQSWTVNGAATQTNSTEKCLWYGCANFTTNGGDYLNSTLQFNFTGNYSLSFFIRPENVQSGSQSYYKFSDGPYDSDENFKSAEEGDFSLNTRWRYETGGFSFVLGSSYSTPENQWTHYCQNYDQQTLATYRNGVLLNNRSAAFGDSNFTLGEVVEVGRGVFGIDLEGYMDEFVVVLTEDFDCQAEYNLKITGTPPAVDIHFDAVTYAIPWIKNSSNHTVINESESLLEVTINYSNAGTESTNATNITLIMDNGTVYDQAISALSAGESGSVSFNLSVGVGNIYNGDVYIDYYNTNSEDDETNNQVSFYLPYKNRPLFFAPDCDSPIAGTPHASGCSWHNSFVSDAVNTGWNVDNVDPRGKKAWENGVTCFVSEGGTTTACERAEDHLVFWGSFSADEWDAGSVQATHQSAFVSLTLDVMWQYLDPDLAVAIANNLSQNMVGGVATGTDLETDPAVPERKCGNGFGGFGANFGAASHAIVGLTPQNPTQLFSFDDEYYVESIADIYANRQESFAKCATPLDYFFLYPETGVYTGYAGQGHANGATVSRTLGIGNLSAYDYFYNQYTLQYPYIFTDFLYNGDTIRNDEGRTARQISRGDGNSYEDIGSDTPYSYQLIGAFANLATNSSIKKAALALMNIFDDNGQNDGVTYATSVYKQLYDNVSGVATFDEIPKFAYAEQFGDYVIRSAFTYVRDHIFYLYSGDNDDAGHPNAQGYSIWCFGEPFIDYAQVPLNDDVRDEHWNPGVTFNNQSDLAGYIVQCGEANHYRRYGNDQCNLNTDSDGRTYRVEPEFRHNHTDVFGTFDGRHATSIEYLKFDGSSDVIQQWVHLPNGVRVLRTIVNDTPTNLAQQGFINFPTEFNYTVRNDHSFTLQRLGTTYHLDIDVLYNETAITAYSWDTGQQASNTKTGSATLNVTYQRYVQEAKGPMDFVNVYSCFNNTNGNNLTKTGDYFDVNDHKIYFDLDDNGSIDEGLWKTDAWAVTEINSTHYMASGASTIFYNGTELYNGERSSFISTFDQIVENDTRSPAIVSVSNVTSNTSVNITVVTDEIANLSVNFSNSQVYTNVNFGTSSLVEITGLTPETTYTYNVTVTDTSGNENSSTGFSVTTDASPLDPGDCDSLANYFANKEPLLILKGGTLQVIAGPQCTFDPSEWSEGPATGVISS